MLIYLNIVVHFCVSLVFLNVVKVSWYLPIDIYALPLEIQLSRLGGLLSYKAVLTWHMCCVYQTRGWIEWFHVCIAIPYSLICRRRITFLRIKLHKLYITVVSSTSSLHGWYGGCIIRGRNCLPLASNWIVVFFFFFFFCLVRALLKSLYNCSVYEEDAMETDKVWLKCLLTF